MASLRARQPGQALESTASMAAHARIGACQTPEILGDIEAALRCIDQFARRSDAADVDLLLFPECFLQGYLVEPQHVEEHALALTSPSFQTVLDRLRPLHQTLVFGVIEHAGTSYFNTAVVVRHGALVTSYRKTHLGAGERLFQPGTNYPTFDVNGIRCGINICNDTNFAEAAAAVASQGADLLLVPSQNMMKCEAAEAWKDRHNAIRSQRVIETGMWLASADVSGARDESRIAYGPTCIMSPDAELVAHVPTMCVGMAVAGVRSRRATTPRGLPGA
jgi:5-aminopentanamidase